MIDQIHENNFKLAEPENYRGIEYVRLSILPAEQKYEIRENYSRDKIFKILKDNSLINDCMIFTDYVAWHNLRRELINHF